MIHLSDPKGKLSYYPWSLLQFLLQSERAMGDNEK